MKARIAIWGIFILSVTGGSLITLNHLYPLAETAIKREYAATVLAADGTTMRRFADAEGVWRYPIALDEVSPLYIEALLGYEDRWFYLHPGVNPLALVRAAGQAVVQGRVVSGGSTLTMQVARLIDPVPRNIGGKLRQMLRALQLEWYLDKRQILTLYMNRAPFGGPLEGVQAASLFWLDKPAGELTHAEAALFAVLPQRPSDYRPDRHPRRAQQARNKVLKRMHDYGAWSARDVTEARMEPVAVELRDAPFIAPLLAQRVINQRGRGIQLTALDTDIQMAVEGLLAAEAGRLTSKASAAVLVVENRSMLVRAYAGSLDFHDNERQGQVDMISAIRSPGSTLKPLMYGMAIDAGLVHSHSLLSDVPSEFNGYRPVNFSGGFNGPVTLAEAMTKSLNVPAVQVLHHYGPNRFATLLQQAGHRLRFPHNGKPNLAVILGGTGASLESLVASYASLARGGLRSEIRFSEDDQVNNRRLLSPGAAWIVREILRSQKTPLNGYANRRIAWKTGTSYGYRDAWSIGVGERYTVGVWIGRADHSPVAGSFGSRTATPLMFRLFDALPQDTPIQTAAPPESVRRETICWPSGKLKQPGRPCRISHQAWILDEVVPPTLADGRSLSMAGDNWPLALTPYLSSRRRITKQRAEYPPLDRVPKILQPSGDNRLSSAHGDPSLPTIKLEAVGGNGRLIWLDNGRPIKTDNNAHYRFAERGRHRLTVLDTRGQYDYVDLLVMGESSPPKNR